eukprot:s8818_g1.t2
MLNLDDGAFGTAGIQSGKVLWRRWTLELEVFCTGWTVFFESGEVQKVVGSAGLSPLSLWAGRFEWCEGMETTCLGNKVTGKTSLVRIGRVKAMKAMKAMKAGCAGDVFRVQIRQDAERNYQQ